MVTCKEVAERLSDFLSSELEEQLREQIEHHLRHCRRCSVLLDSVRKVILISADDRLYEIPIGFSQRLHAFLDQQVLRAENPAEPEDNCDQ